MIPDISISRVYQNGSMFDVYTFLFILIHFNSRAIYFDGVSSWV